MLLIPFNNLVLYPALRRLGLRADRAAAHGLGIAFSGLAWIAAGAIQLAIDGGDRCRSPGRCCPTRCSPSARCWCRRPASSSPTARRRVDEGRDHGAGKSASGEGQPESAAQPRAREKTTPSPPYWNSRGGKPRSSCCSSRASRSWSRSLRSVRKSVSHAGPLSLGLSQRHETPGCHQKSVNGDAFRRALVDFSVGQVVRGVSVLLLQPREWPRGHPPPA